VEAHELERLRRSLAMLAPGVVASSLSRERVTGNRGGLAIASALSA
jgi:hypothetical protein